MNNGDIDRMFSEQALRPVNAAVLSRVRSTVFRSLSPVRPLPGTGALAAAFLMVCCLAGVGGGFLLRVVGWPAMTPMQRAVIFALLVLFAVAASVVSAWEMIPGARRLRAVTVLLLCFGAMEAAFALLLPDHGMGNFVHSGLLCLTAGTIVAVPAGAAACILLRRGAVLDRASAAVAIGMLAGLAGLGALEIHCPNLRLWHVAVWHMGVLAVAVGAGVTAAFARFSSRP